MRIVTALDYRGRRHDLFQVHTIDARRLSEESVETPEYKAEKARRIAIYQQKVKHQMALGDD